MRTGAALAALLLLLSPGYVHAQDDPTRPLIRGRVLDADTRQPLMGAFILPFGGARAVATDSLGVFAIPMELAPRYPLTVEQLGYATMTVTLPESAPGEFSTILLRPNPLELEGLTVLVDRFERRRRFFFGPVRVLDQDRLLRSARATAYDLVRAEVPMARPCAGDFDNLCTLRRGRSQRVDICVDEVPLWAGVNALESYDPSELYLVEVYDRGAEVRLYTRYFVESRLRSGRSLPPLSWGCRAPGS